MHSWLWGERHPGFMDGLVPLTCIPTQIAGRNRMWRKLMGVAVGRRDRARGGGVVRRVAPSDTPPPVG